MKIAGNKLCFLQVVLISVYFPLFAYATNVGETSFFDFVFVFCFFLIFGCATYFLFIYIFKSREKSSVFSSIFLLLFLNGGHLFAVLNRYNSSLFRFRYLLPISVFFFIYLFVRVRRTHKSKFFISTAFVLPLALINGYNLFNAGVGLYRANQLIEDYKRQNSQFINQHLSTLKNKAPDSFPDVYFILLDAYTSNASLKEYYNLDNSDFLRSLREDGFVVPKSSYSNYPCTRHSMPATLNMNHLNLSHWRDEGIAYYLTYHIWHNNNASLFFRAAGYKNVYLSTKTSLLIDRPLRYGDFSNKGFFDYLKLFFRKPLVKSDFILFCIGRTLLLPVSERLSVYFFRDLLIQQLDTLKQTVSISGPKFVFSYFLCPHFPFVFDSQGGIPEGSMFDWKNYPGQVSFISREIKKVLDHIIKNSKKEPIIILQADHGPPLFDIQDTDPEGYTKTLFGILNAYYLPADKRHIIYEGITPINNFRLIFDNFLGGKFGLLDDSSYIVAEQYGKIGNVDHFLDK